MSTATTIEATPATENKSHWMTTEELLALPEDDTVERWLLWGKLIERPMTRGMIVSGEAGFRLSHQPDFTVGIDAAYFSAEQAAATAKRAFLIEGPPVLAAEILSSSDRVEDVGEKIEGYLQAGVKLAWRVEPVFDIVTVFRPEAEPEGLNVSGFLDGGPHLPGFRVPVAELFS